MKDEPAKWRCPKCGVAYRPMCEAGVWARKVRIARCEVPNCFVYYRDVIRDGLTGRNDYVVMYADRPVAA